MALCTQATTYLLELQVRRDWQGKGIGSALLCAIPTVNSDATAGLTATVLHENDGAMRLYCRHGLVQIDTSSEGSALVSDVWGPNPPTLSQRLIARQEAKAAEEAHLVKAALDGDEEAIHELSVRTAREEERRRTLREEGVAESIEHHFVGAQDSNDAWMAYGHLLDDHQRAEAEIRQRSKAGISAAGTSMAAAPPSSETSTSPCRELAPHKLSGSTARQPDEEVLSRWRVLLGAARARRRQQQAEAAATLAHPAPAEPSNAAALPQHVTHGLTLKGAQLAYALLRGPKCIENRDFRLKPGWYALHAGASMQALESQRELLAKVPGMPPEADLPHSAIIGAIRVSHVLSLEQCQSNEWAFGPLCNVVDAVALLKTPVPHSGALSVWQISAEARQEVHDQLASAPVIPKDVSHLPGPNAPGAPLTTADLPLLKVAELRVAAQARGDKGLGKRDAVEARLRVLLETEALEADAHAMSGSEEGGSDDVGMPEAFEGEAAMSGSLEGLCHGTYGGAGAAVVPWAGGGTDRIASRTTASTAMALGSAALGATALGASAPLATVKKRSGHQQSESSRVQMHREQLRSAFQEFRCKCDRAMAKGLQSCLDNFTKVELRATFAETYGAAALAEEEGDAQPGAAAFKIPKLKEVSERLHRYMWELKVPLAEMDALGRSFTIPKWTVNGIEVCKYAWRKLRGGTARRIRDLQVLVMRGHGPAERQAGQLAKLEMAVQAREASAEKGRQIFAVNWWARELGMHDWLPNEQAVRFRGQGYGFVHKHLYSPASAAAGLRPYSYKTWRALPSAALKQLHDLGQLPGSDLDKLRMKRSANHSAFPECDECQQRRKRYYNAAKARGADPSVVAEFYRAILEHKQQWADDRSAALRLKYSTYESLSDACYECDDGCGSFWQALPVDPTGRDCKQSVAAKYKFAIQANAIVGPRGVQRFTVMPKNVRKGANFGLTNFIFVLHRAWKAGRLGPHVRRCYRHTDGGPDNVSWVTHVVHWLLVFIGVFDEIIWFRFEAGHSHTEIADRLFGILKKLFDSDSKARVGPLETFAELESKLRETFAKAQEHFELGFDFANWDFEEWFTTSQFDTDDAFEGKKLVDNSFSGYSFDLVFKYAYVGDALWQHGGVKVCTPTLSRRRADVDVEPAHLCQRP